MLVMLIARKHLGLLPASSSLPDKLGTKVVPLAIDLSESSLPRSGRSSRSVALNRSSFDFEREREREKEVVIFYFRILVTLDMRIKM